jgi:signal transduction histidine kinase
MPDQHTQIIVIDDDDVKRYTIVHTLRRSGFEVAEGATGADALRLAATAALLVLDVKLHDMNGFEVCRRLKADPSTAHIPILLLSATFMGVESQVEGLDSGADAYLTSVAEPPVMVATIRALLRMRGAEERSRGNEARLRIALAAGGLGEWDLDISTGVLTCSAQCKANFGRPTDLAFSLAELQEAIHPDDRAEALAVLRRAIDRGNGYDSEYRVVCPSGEVRWILMRGQSVQFGGHRKLIGVSLDITQQKRAEETLKEADRRKDEFLAMLAHELRNPLAPIRTALEVERQPGADHTAITRARETMARQLSNMVRLIDDLLDVSRITKGKVELRRERVELAAVLGTAIETSRPLIEAGRHELKTTLPTTPVWLDADPTRLAQVVSNLLNNAAKYTPEGGSIRLSAAVTPGPKGKWVEIRVADNGTGIPPDVLPRMWDMFAQADRTIGRSQGGLGIGLTLVKWLVELHGGAVHAWSGGKGQGSEFIVRLPVTEATDVPRDHTTSKAQKSPTRRILVVDDNVDGRETMAMLLELSGHAVRTAEDGPSALRVADEFRPDVILLDIGLPGMDGYQVAQQIRANPALHQVRLIALTGWGQDSDRERSQHAGFDLHLVKPVDPVALSQVL